MNYGVLKSDTAAYLHRTDLTTPIPFFIEKARLRIARDLKSLEQEQTATLTGPTNSVFALPATCQEVRKVEAGGVPLRAVGAYELAYWASLASPAVYAIRGRNITVPGATTVDIWYYATEATLTSDATEHPTMAAYPQIWQLATLMEAGLYLQDWDLHDRTREQYVLEVEAVNSRASDLRYGVAPAQITDYVQIQSMARL
jgi:hypothetical protein